MKVGLPEEILPALAAAGDGGAGAGAVVLAHAEAATEEVRSCPRPCLLSLATMRTTHDVVTDHAALRICNTTPPLSQVAVEAAVAAALAPVGASLRLLWGHTLLHVDDTGMSPQDIPIVFAQFTKRVTAAPRPPAPSEAFGAAELPLARSAVSTADWEADGPTLRDLGYTDSEPAEARSRQRLRRFANAPLYRTQPARRPATFRSVFCKFISLRALPHRTDRTDAGGPARRPALPRRRGRRPGPPALLPLGIRLRRDVLRHPRRHARPRLQHEAFALARAGVPEPADGGGGGGAVRG